MDAGSSIRVRRSGGRRWVRAFFVALAIEALLNWASLFACADYSFSLKVTCLRVALMLGMFALYRVFRKDSRIWRVSLDLSRRPQFIAVCILITLMSAFLLGLSRISGQAEWLERGAVYEEGIQAVQDGNQYDYLADAFLAGGVELDLPRSDILLSMDNPYDTLLRQQLNAEAHEPIYWDYAFYQGKYYCYFGALPCLLAFVPYKAITGCDLRTDWAVVFFACAMLISGAALLYQLARTYYRDLSFGAFLEGVPVSKPSLVFGALLVACTLGCRPQYVLAAVLIVAIFWPEIRARRFFSRVGLGNTLAVIAPFLVVAVPVCLYNQARFGSPFDFGASYNLIGADMTAYAFDPIVIAARSLEYLFLPPVMQGSYPFLHAIDDVAGLPTVMWTNEPVFGGFFAFAPAALVVFALFGVRMRRALKARGVLGICATSVILAGTTLVIVSYVSGVTMRYFADFAWLIVVPATMVIWSVMVGERTQGNVRVSGWLAALVLLGFPLYCWTFLATSRFGAIMDASPSLYYGAEALLRFL